MVFEHPIGAERLDTFLVRRGGALDLRQRLRLVREIAETIQWAHAQGLHHRTLTPAAVLVVRPDDESPAIKLRNWQVGSLPEATIAGQTITWHDFVQVGLAGRDEDAVYLAPELRGGGKPDPALLDVFSLGALAWHILTGRPPAASPEELLQRLTEHQGLRLSAVLDGIDEDLEALVQLATSPDLADRPSATDFLANLEEPLRKLAAVAADVAPSGAQVHPLDAQHGAALDGGFVVERRLGSGSTAIALLVERDGMQGGARSRATRSSTTGSGRKGRCSDLPVHRGQSGSGGAGELRSEGPGCAGGHAEAEGRAAGAEGVQRRRRRVQGAEPCRRSGLSPRAHHRASRSERTCTSTLRRTTSSWPCCRSWAMVTSCNARRRARAPRTRRTPSAKPSSLGRSASCWATLDEVGARAGVTKARVQQIERSGNLEIMTLVRLAAALGYNVAIQLQPLDRSKPAIARVLEPAA